MGRLLPSHSDDLTAKTCSELSRRNAKVGKSFLVVRRGEVRSGDRFERLERFELFEQSQRATRPLRLVKQLTESLVGVGNSQFFQAGPDRCLIAVDHRFAEIMLEIIDGFDHARIGAT